MESNGWLVKFDHKQWKLHEIGDFLSSGIKKIYFPIYIYINTYIATITNVR